MAIEIARIKVVTSGWLGGPGLSQLYCTGSTAGTVTLSDCNAAAAAVNTFYSALVAQFPNAWSAQVEPIVQVIEATTGALIREQPITPIAPPSGSAGGSWGPTATGAIATWHTSSVFGRHLLRGRTFLTPLMAGSYNSSGQLTAGTVSTIQAAGATLAGLSTARMVVWHRPHPTSASANGGYGQMVGCTVSATEAVLRSRRD